jgi:hypothetical protein
MVVPLLRPATRRNMWLAPEFIAYDTDPTPVPCGEKILGFIDETSRNSSENHVMRSPLR